MIRNPKLLKKFEDEFVAKESLSIEQKFKILNAMLEEAKALGVIPLKDPLEDIEVDIKIARFINAIPEPSETDSTTA